MRNKEKMDKVYGIMARENERHAHIYGDYTSRVNQTDKQEDSSHPKPSYPNPSNNEK